MRHAEEPAAAGPTAAARRCGEKDAGRAFGFIDLQVPQEGEEVTRETFRFQVNKDKLKKAELRDGYYLLRSNLVAEGPAVQWERYVQLTQMEAAFQSLKSELGIGPIYPQLGHRVEAHILLAFLAYCLLVTLKVRLQALAPGLTPRAVWEKLAAIQMLDVWLPTTRMVAGWGCLATRSPRVSGC